MLTASEDGKARLWNIATGALEPVSFVHKGPVYAAEFNRDGTLIATCGDDLTALVWNAADGKPLLVLQGHSRAVRAVAFSPDSESGSPPEATTTRRSSGTPRPARRSRYWKDIPRGSARLPSPPTASGS